MSAPPREHRPADVAGLVVALLASFAVAAFGSRFPPGEWYQALNQPAWTPPDWVFGPVWTVLYVLMAIAAWRVWRLYSFSGAGLALGLFIVQLVLNGLWSFLFFGLRSPGAALVDILLLLVAVAATTVLFWRLDRTAGWLLLPYLVWVAYATTLNAGVWVMN